MHGSQRPIVWHIFYNRETRTAISAVNKRIIIPAIGGIEQFSPTLRTNVQVGRERDGFFRTDHAGFNAKVVVSECVLYSLTFDAIDAADWRRTFLEGRFEVLDVFRIALHQDFYALGVVIDSALQVKLPGKAKNPRAKTDPLHDSGDFDDFGQQLGEFLIK